MRNFRQRMKLNSLLQVLSCTSSEVLACGRPPKPIARISINGPLSPACCGTAPPVTWRYPPVLLLNSDSSDGNWSLQTTIFGHKLKAPLFLAPIGVQGILHPEAEIATARAAKETKIPIVLSTAATRSMEEVARVLEDDLRWYQLYW